MNSGRKNYAEKFFAGFRLRSGKSTESRRYLAAIIMGNIPVGVLDLFPVFPESEFPNLTCILCDIGIWGVDRYSWPLLEKYPNLYLETSLLSLENYGLEATVQRFGSDKLVFGSGFPERYPESAMLQLLHADISEYDKKKIAGLNLENLIAKVKL